MSLEKKEYFDDRERAGWAKEHLSPKDYIIRIKWSDKTIKKLIKDGNNFSSGWFKTWSNNWVENLWEDYAEIYDAIEFQEVYRLGHSSWPETLTQIKSDYKDYYNSKIMMRKK